MPFGVPPTSPGAAAGPAGRRRWPWVAAALVLLAALVGGGIVVLTQGDDGSSEVAKDHPAIDDSQQPDDAGDDPDSDDATDESSGDATTEPAPSESGVVTPSGTPPPSAPTSASAPSAPLATCWDGSTAPAVAGCSRPQGLAGLSYVFPSMSTQDCTPIGGAAPGRKLLVQCYAHLSDGTRIKVNYSQWASVSAAIDHYEGKGLTRTEANGLYFFGGYALTGELNSAAVYKKEPYSASVYALDQVSLSEALTTLVARGPDEVRGSAG
jgi:hypothetical protein